MIEQPDRRRSHTRRRVCAAVQARAAQRRADPVRTPQPTSAASSGISGSIRTTEFSCSSIFSA